MRELDLSGEINPWQSLHAQIRTVTRNHTWQGLDDSIYLETMPTKELLRGEMHDAELPEVKSLNDKLKTNGLFLLRYPIRIRVFLLHVGINGSTDVCATRCYG